MLRKKTNSFNTPLARGPRPAGIEGVHPTHAPSNGYAEHVKQPHAFLTQGFHSKQTAALTSSSLHSSTDQVTMLPFIKYLHLKL